MTKKSMFRGRLIALVVGALLPVVAAAQTLDRVRSGGAIDVGFVQNAAPFSSASSGGGAQGYSIDLCMRVVDKLKSSLKLTRLDVKYTPATVSDGLDKVANGSIDILCGSVTDTLARRRQVSFSIPIYNGGIGVLLSSDAPKDLTRVLNGEVAHEGPVWRATINQGLANHTYAVHDETVTEDWVRDRVASLGAQVTIVTVDKHQLGIDMVASGKADAYFADRAILSNYAESKSDLQVLERYFNYEPIALAVARNDSDMRLAVDTALSELYLSDDFEAVYTSHFGKPGKTTLMFFKSFARH